jgi:hypothetical protein
VLDLKHVLLGYYFISFEEEFGPSCDCTWVRKCPAWPEWDGLEEFCTHFLEQLHNFQYLNISDKQCGLSTGFEKNTWFSVPTQWHFSPQ